MERELTKDLFKFRDFSYEDFKKLPEERRFEVVATLSNCPPRGLVQLAFNPYKVYTSGGELREELSKYLKIPYDELYEYKDFIPIDPATYWYYVRDTMSRINLVARVKITPEKFGYALTSFGNHTKPFVAYMLKRAAEAEINPWELFGKTGSRGKRAPMRATKILESIYQKGRTSEIEIAKNLIMRGSKVHYYLKRFEKLGLIEYECIALKWGEYKEYKVDKEKVEEILKNWDELEIRKKIKREEGTTQVKEVLEHLKNREEVHGKELKELYGSRYTERLMILWRLEVIDSEMGKGKFSKVEITEKGKKVYELIMKPVIEVSENPDSIEKYRDELSDEDKRKIIWLYSEWREIYGKRKEMILKTLKHGEGLTVEEISKITGINKGTINEYLTDLEKKGLVQNEKGEWKMAKHVG